MFYGIKLDDESRCQHYHGPNDVVSLKCATCKQYYACYKCHNSLEDHIFTPSDETEPFPVLCGACKKVLSFENYQLGYCCYCQHEFNPKCKNHATFYFKRS